MTRIETSGASRVFQGNVDMDAVYAFARATNDENPRYASGDAAPPLFSVSLIFDAWMAAQRAAVDRCKVNGYTGGVHGEHDVLFRAPIRPGTPVRWFAEPYCAKYNKVGVLMSVRVVVTDLDDMPLVEHLWTTLFIGGKIEAEFGDDLPGHGFPEEARARPLGAKTIVVDRDQGFRYAGISGDRVGHAIDDEIARAQGHPGKILQGMCTFSMCSGAAVDVLAAGDPTRLRRLSCRFAAPTRPNRELLVEFYDAGRCEDGARAIAFEASQGSATVIKHGRAELLPD